MKRLRTLALALILSATLIVAAALILKDHCPAAGIAFSTERRELQLLKNRTAIPQPADFDPAVTLAKMLEPGDDRQRWSNTRAARVEGYVISIANGPIELTNCSVPFNRDIHIHIGLRPDAPPREQFVLEITPRMQDWASRQGCSRLTAHRSLPTANCSWDWSEETLRSEMLGPGGMPGKWVSFEGWLIYDSHHAAESENTAPGRPDNWRATAWEIHPITNFEFKQLRQDY